MVGVPGTALDTDNVGDQAAITNLVSQEALPDNDLRVFLQGIAAKLHGMSAYEQGVLNDGAKRLVRRTDARVVRDEAANGGVWCRGRVFANSELHGTLTALERATARGGQQFAYLNPNNMFEQPRVDATRNDAELPVLEEISNILTGKDWRQLWRVRIVLSGSQGPCDVCKGRIRALMSDLNAMALANHVQVTLNFEANYTTVYQANAAQQGIATSYGYADAVRTDVPPGVSYSFWSKTFQFTLGNAPALQF
ncbi:MAG: hypothetical protein HOQ24_14815 [Mycobacteriaceae bacterium]|nr:hypothetical protein [Mycobacteriaceae bacterium]